MTPAFIILTAALAGLVALPALAAPATPYGQWRVTLDHPGGALPFGLEVIPAKPGSKAGPTAYLRNPPERLRVENVSVDGETITLAFPSYNSRLVLTHDANDRLTGRAEVKRSTGAVTLAATGTRGGYRFTPSPQKPAADLTGKWLVSFQGAKPVTGLAQFKQVGNLVSGSVQLPSGDTRYLAGELAGNKLSLSTFDGSYSALWNADLAGGVLTGKQFAATSTAGSSWTARRAGGASIEAVAVEKSAGERLAFRFPTSDGKQVSLADPRYKGKVVVITLGGAWCPNCHDEAIFMGPYATRRAREGLEVIGMQFEYGDDKARAFRQMDSFQARYKLPYPLVLAGQPTPESTKAALGALGPVKVYPSTIFIGRDGRVREVHVGWAGPATGALNVKAKRDFDATVTRLLKERA
ncbi:peroxiredoxin family protein [Polymorphobacter fuscus]|uniref:Redoxin family protein n=1 Tax=Sandarakinorhabdus fusca TaxID=1439888 RepID=A0A7C9GSS6_9SPHN|nr:TlpA disulfide reductase family protein [Polymorphobacter fuscus]KAB7648206.1 TlpA family protein disulfide reductase [Polymorphobacter fuscus]MQT15709.1 redoxin family protein [Polymorphobacter fuscus]NJC08020.1 peroxiredoxin [Polymorphobacter fuscus]